MARRLLLSAIGGFGMLALCTLVNSMVADHIGHTQMVIWFAPILEELCKAALRKLGLTDAVLVFSMLENAQYSAGTVDPMALFALRMAVTTPMHLITARLPMVVGTLVHVAFNLYQNS